MPLKVSALSHLLVETAFPFTGTLVDLLPTVVGLET